MKPIDAHTLDALGRGQEKARRREAEAEAALTEEEHAAIKAGKRAEDKLREARARQEQVTVGSLATKLSRLDPSLVVVGRVPGERGEGGCWPLVLTTVHSTHGFEYLVLEGDFEAEEVCAERRG